MSRLTDRLRTEMALGGHFGSEGWRQAQGPCQLGQRRKAKRNGLFCRCHWGSAALSPPAYFPARKDPRIQRVGPRSSGLDRKAALVRSRLSRSCRSASTPNARRAAREPDPVGVQLGRCRADPASPFLRGSTHAGPSPSAASSRTRSSLPRGWSASSSDNPMASIRRSMRAGDIGSPDIVPRLAGRAGHRQPRPKDGRQTAFARSGTPARRTRVTRFVGSPGRLRPALRHEAEYAAAAEDGCDSGRGVAAQVHHDVNAIDEPVCRPCLPRGPYPASHPLAVVRRPAPSPPSLRAASASHARRRSSCCASC